MALLQPPVFRPWLQQLEHIPDLVATTKVCRCMVVFVAGLAQEKVSLLGR